MDLQANDRSCRKPTRSAVGRYSGWNVLNVYDYEAIELCLTPKKIDSVPIIEPCHARKPRKRDLDAKAIKVRVVA